MRAVDEPCRFDEAAELGISRPLLELDSESQPDRPFRHPYVRQRAQAVARFFEGFDRGLRIVRVRCGGCFARTVIARYVIAFRLRRAVWRRGAAAQTFARLGLRHQRQPFLAAAALVDERSEQWKA